MVERETIILFNEAEDTAEIETCNAELKKRLEAIRRRHPKKISLIWSGEYASFYVFPKSWVRMNTERKI